MMVWQITAIDTEPSAGRTHEHVSDLFLNETHWRSREQAIADIRSPYGDRYFTLVHGHQAEVTVVGCPVCGFRDYLRTKADAYHENNLLSLPRKRRVA